MVMQLLRYMFTHVGGGDDNTTNSPTILLKTGDTSLSTCFLTPKPDFPTRPTADVAKDMM